MSDTVSGFGAGFIMGAILIALMLASVLVSAENRADKEAAERGFAVIHGQLFCRVIDPPKECQP